MSEPSPLIDHPSSSLSKVLSKTILAAFEKDRLVSSDFIILPFQNNYFNAVIDRESLCQNSFSDIILMVPEIFRILKPGGKYFGINFSDKDPNINFGENIGKGDYDNFFYHYDGLPLLDLKIRSKVVEGIATDEV